MSKEERRVIYMVAIGILVFFVLASIPVLIFTKDKLRCELGLFIGSVMAVLMLWHMNATIYKAVHLEKHHSAYLAWSSVGRLLVVAGLIVLATWTGIANPIFMVVGMLGLKFGAYVEPFLEKRFEIKNKQ